MAGRANFEDRGDFLSLGPVVGFDLLAPLGESSEVVGNARYRFLPTVSGCAPDVSWLDVSPKYR